MSRDVLLEGDVKPIAAVDQEGAGAGVGEDLNSFFRLLCSDDITALLHSSIALVWMSWGS